VSAGWVAGSVRSRLLARRRVGREGVRSIAGASSPAEAIELLARTPYGHDVDATMSAADARHAIARTALWHLRILAGWLTPQGADTVRTLAGWFEIANIEAHLAGLSGSPDGMRFELGALGVVWSRVRAATSPDEVRAILVSSSWGDPGGESAPEMAVGLRLSWARRLYEGVPVAAEWAAGYAAITVAAELAAFHRTLTGPASSQAVRVLGGGWKDAGWSEPVEVAARLPGTARWVLDGIEDWTQLWLAEGAWRRRVEDDALRLVARSGTGPDVVVGAAALLLVDAWLARAALEAAAWGDVGREVLDASV